MLAKEVRWAHAANDEAQLRAALADDSVSMVEADIMFRTTSASSPPGARGEITAQPQPAAGVPVMAHPPSIPPDAMTFEAWFDLILEHNQQAAHTSQGRTQKGVKLDFKSQHAVAPCLAILLARRAAASHIFDFPVWLNADVLPGPGGSSSAFDGPSFVEECQRALPGAVLSLGWTTGYPTNERDMQGYTADMVDAMLALIDDHVKEGTHVTFPLQLWYAHRSWPQVERLLARQQAHEETAQASDTDDQQRQRALVSSVTLWGEEVAKIRQWVEATTHYLAGRIYIDLVPPATTSSRV